MRPVITLCVASLLLCASSALAGDQDFTLHNETGKEIYELYVSPNDVEDWQEDVLGDDTLGDGDEVDITFDRSENATKWDLRVDFADGKSSVWSSLKLTEITDVTISYRNGKPYASWKNGE